MKQGLKIVIVSTASVILFSIMSLTGIILMRRQIISKS